MILQTKHYLMCFHVKPHNFSAHGMKIINEVARETTRAHRAEIQKD